MSTYEERVAADAKLLDGILQRLGGAVKTARRARVRTVSVLVDDVDHLILMAHLDRKAMEIIHRAAALVRSDQQALSTEPSEASVKSQKTNAEPPLITPEIQHKDEGL